MIAHSDSEGWSYRKAKFERLIEQFIAGQIGEPTLEVSLQILGYRGQALAAEISLARAKKAERNTR